MELVYVLKKMFVPPHCFENNELEKEFLRNYGQKFLYHRRAVIIIGLCTWSLYIVWDIFHAYMNLEFAKVSSEIYTLRVIGILILIPIVWLMYTRFGVNEHKATIILSSGVCTCYLLLLLMINIVPFPYDYLYYYIGLLLVLFFMFGLMRLRAKPVIVLALLCLVASGLSFYFDSTVKLAPLEKTQKIVNGYYWSAAMSYLITFMMIGCAISIELERTARKTFFREKELQNSNRETENRTTALLLLKDQSSMRLEEKNNYKSKFFADMAHDLGNSMQCINSFFQTSLYAVNQENFELAQQYFEDLGKSLGKMSATLNTVLNISEFELGVRKVNYTNFNVQDLVEDVVSNLAPFAVKQGVLLRLKKKGNVAFVKSDIVNLSRVLTNLITNAIKYSDFSKKSQVVIVVIVCLPQYIRIEIIDNGIGIPESQIQNMFEPFVRLNDGENTIQGSGLGLSIVNVLIDILDGHRIEVTSREKQWTRFSIEIPTVSNEGIGLINSNSNNNQNINTSLNGIYVLIIEDDPLVGKATFELLSQNGALCDMVDSLESLLAILPELERDPNVVLTDYRLPNGHTAVDVIDVVKNKFGDDIPFLIITGEVVKAQSDESLQGLKILSKPITLTDIIKNINVICKKL